MTIVAREPAGGPGVDGEALAAHYARIAHDFKPRPIDVALRGLDIALAAADSSCCPRW